MARPFNFPSPQSVLIGNPTMFVPAELAISLLTKTQITSQQRTLVKALRTGLSEKSVL
ncbi:hypothetical protein XNC1_1671 [Xenorhabdus nematophila ATCC 19061]|uniref:Uncharacterized protein n=1 Tax=Xenorhabdus nematophila (strain ATCC 19061 / DSM 3370 / CCUG 14189 / LMG 1036 / NCIMB 9965 / AN6) TaxID=406817 RepID=D3VC78_XENNA|nr:hypothetical protein XNC1_1671 [Xenorhabdus nematophila ATCC 19061]CEK22613.1 hypothetical protein XNC2_1619 [Xenorhabdus nematophila AN6/1]